MSANKPPFDGECKRVKLNDIAVVKVGNVAPKKDDFSKIGTPFVRAGSLTSLLAGGMLSDLELIDEPTAQKLRMTLFPEGTVVFAKSGMSCMTGNVYVLPEPCYVVSHLACVIPVGDYAVYLKHYFRSNRPSKLVENPSFPSIRLSKIQNMELEIPVRSEMEKQVRSLEHIESLIEWSKEQIAMLDTLVKSRFVEIFGSYSNEFETTLQDVSEFVTVGIANAATHAYVDSGVVMLRNLNVRENQLEDSDLVYIDPEFAAKYKKKRLKAGDILVTRTGYPGIACVVPKKYEGCQTFTTLIVRLRDDSPVTAEYVSQLINSPIGKEFVGRFKAGSSQQNFGATALKMMPIGIPPLALQQEFAAFVAEVDKSRFIVKQKIEKLQMLYDSLAQEYFG